MLVLILTLILWNTNENENLYPATYEVVGFETETDTVVCVDANGYEWAFYGIEDWQIGDQVSAIMDTNGTDEIFDDSFVRIRYTGKRRQQK